MADKLPRRPDNVFGFRRLKWGVTRKLRVLGAVEAAEAAAPVATPRGGGISWLGLALVGIVGGFAIVMSLLGWF